MKEQQQREEILSFIGGSGILKDLNGEASKGLKRKIGLREIKMNGKICTNKEVS